MEYLALMSLKKNVVCYSYDWLFNIEQEHDKLILIVYAHIKYPDQHVHTFVYDT